MKPQGSGKVVRAIFLAFVTPQTPKDPSEVGFTGPLLPSAAGGRGFNFVARPRGGLAKFDKQIQEKHIHEKPNLYNLLTEHSVWL